MASQNYRITDSTIALFEEDGRHIAHHIPGGSIITVLDGPLDGNKLINFLWADKKVMMFTQDLRTRAKAVDGNGE